MRSPFYLFRNRILDRVYISLHFKVKTCETRARELRWCYKTHVTAEKEPRQLYDRQFEMIDNVILRS